jgi:PAS domain S-box-containing protein
MPTELGPRVRGFVTPALANSPVWGVLLDAPVASLVCDEHGALLLANQAMLDLLGHPLERVLGDGWVALLSGEHPESAPAVKKDLLEVLPSSGTVRHRKEIVTADGEPRSLEMTTSAARLPDGARGMIAIAVESVGLRVNTGRHGGERGYRELVEDAPDVISRFDARTGSLLFVNRSIERFTGYTPEDFFIDPALWMRVLSREARVQWEPAMMQVQKGDARAFDLGLRHRDGRMVIVQQALYPIRDATGQVRYVEGTARDITAVRQLEQLKARNEERASLERLKSQLLANVSHELRTPLVSIKGYNELLLRGALGPLTTRQRRGLEIAGANTERLIELIETLLDFARREEGRLELRTTRVDMRDAAEDAVRALEERIRSRNLTLRVELGTQPLYVVGDRGRLGQVFRALLGNAEKFSEASGGEILISAETAPDYVSLSVRDRGIGIPKDVHAKIFDRFYQVDASSTRRFGGAGLGLALAKELITLHGGTILVESDEGQGSTFTVRLPRALREKIATPAEQTARPVALVGADERSWRALKPILESEVLQPLDVFCEHAAGEIVRRVRRHRPDLVLLAFADAERCVAELKRDAETAALPVVAISAGGLPIARADLVVEAGEPARLVDGLKRLLGRGPAQPRSPRVIIVEDELEILDFTRFILEREGYQVECIAEGEQALAAVDARCDLVILDIALEGSDGIEVCKRLKARPETREVPILIMTAMSGDEVRDLALKAGAAGYLMKPFGVDEFLRQVQLHLRTAEAHARESA